MPSPVVDPVMVQFCRDLKESGIEMDYFHREALFEAIDRMVEARIQAAMTRHLQFHV